MGGIFGVSVAQMLAVLTALIMMLVVVMMVTGRTARCGDDARTARLATIAVGSTNLPGTHAPSGNEASGTAGGSGPSRHASAAGRCAG